MGNCEKCKKCVTKRSPGLECNKCGILVHARTDCAGLTNKQLAAVRAADNLEWTCTACAHSSFRKSSFIVPSDDEEEEDSDSANKELTLDSKKFLARITKEMEKILKKELEETNRSMQFLSDKVEDCLETIEVFKEKIKEMENKNIELTNKNKFLENKIGALEQRITTMEQNNLNKKLEIAGLPETDDENVQEIIRKTAMKLNITTTDIESAHRSRKGKSSVICLEMKNEDARNKWLAAAKKNPITSGDIINAKDPKLSTYKIYIREALTPYIKNLLWKAKQELKDSHQFVWCKNGKIYARKRDKSELLFIRAEPDILRVKNLSG